MAESNECETLPTNQLAEPSTAAFDTGWDSEAPTAVHARHPLFARPARLPSP